MFSEDFSVFVSFVIAIVLEASPFLLFGSLLGALFEVYVSPDRLARRIPKSVFGGVLGAGFILPTCECGVVPIVQRLIKKGVPPHMAVTYMLTAPSVNPIVLVSTYIAFGGSLWMVAGRVFLAVIPALLIGLMLYGRGAEEIVKGGSLPVHNHGHEHGFQMAMAHDHGSPCAHCGHNQGENPERSNLSEVITHTATDFLQMGKYLILGATAAALFKFYTPYNVLILLEHNIFLSVAAMMALAILLSVCSEADAFVAASFASFPAAAKLAFVGIGPMLDLKLMAMYGAAFRKRMVLALMIAPTLIIYGLSLLLGAVTGQ